MEKILLLESSNLYISKASIWTQKKLDPGNNRKFQRNRIMGESLIHGLGAEPSQQQVAAAPAFDLRRAESSRQHVRALNTQFARKILVMLSTGSKLMRQMMVICLHWELKMLRKWCLKLGVMRQSYSL
ncbi:hypothetical protein Ancab_032587 [Ancistrocladus abbreviatus]